MDEELGVTNRRKRKMLPLNKKVTKDDKLQLVSDRNSFTLDLTGNLKNTNVI